MSCRAPRWPRFRLLGCLLWPALPAVAFTPLDTSRPEFPTAADYVTILSRFPAYAERGWHDADDSPPRGWFGDGRSDENGQRTLANFILTYGWLATRPGYDPSESKIPTETIRHHALAALWQAARTHVTGDRTCPDRKPWGNHWQSAWWTSRLFGGAQLLWDDLPAELRERLLKVLEHEADRHLNQPARHNEYGDTKAEENAWDSEVLAWALVLLPGHPHAGAWREAAAQLCLNTLSTAADATSNRVIEGRRLRDWVPGPCIHGDYTIENHGFFHLCYMACPLHSLAWDSYIFRRAGQPVPEFVRHHVPEVWARLKQFALPSGRLAYVAGKDWPRYAYGLYFILPALVDLQQVYGDADARWLEQQRVAAFVHEQEVNGDGSFFGTRFTHDKLVRWPAEWNSDCAANLTIAALLHELGPTPQPTAAAELQRRLAGTIVSPDSEFVVQRDAHRFASWCWKSHGGPVTGLFCSDTGSSMLEWDHNLAGSLKLAGVKGGATVAAHRETLFEGGFATVGTVHHGRLQGGPSPCHLEVADDNVPVKEIVAPDHPLFNTPHHLTSLASLTDLDSITAAGPGWTVLARNARGGPSLLEAALGRGRLILSMTNLEERSVANDPIARQLFENLLAYSGARQHRCGYFRGEAHLRAALDQQGIKYDTLQPSRVDLTPYDVIFIDRTAPTVVPLYPQLLRRVEQGAVVVKSIIQDTGWSPDAIATASEPAVTQEIAFAALPDGRSAVLLSCWRANGEITVNSLDLLDERLANDLFNGHRRAVCCGDPQHPLVVLKGVQGSGEVTRVTSSWLDVDNDVAFISLTGPREFTLTDHQRRLAPAGSLCFTGLGLHAIAEPQRVRPGEILGRAALMLRCGLLPGEAQRVAERLPLNAAWWTPERWTLTVPDANGRTWRIQVRPRQTAITVEQVSERRE